jgi:hypothetical protein
MGQWVVSVLALEPLHLRATLTLRVPLPRSYCNQEVLALRVWLTQKGRRARGVNALVKSTVDLTPKAAPGWQRTWLSWQSTTLY